jgi:starch phosphorylase
MKASMKMALEGFCSLRMVMDYSEIFYAPCARWYDRLAAGGGDEARRFAEQAERVRRLWKDVQVEPPGRESNVVQRVGDSFQVLAEVSLGDLRPDEVDVELYVGHYKSFSELTDSRVIPMEVAEDHGSGRYRYSCRIGCEAAGRFGYSVRATPHGDAWIKLAPGLITWARE